MSLIPSEAAESGRVTGSGPYGFSQISTAVDRGAKKVRAGDGPQDDCGSSVSNGIF